MGRLGKGSEKDKKPEWMGNKKDMDLNVSTFAICQDDEDPQYPSDELDPEEIKETKEPKDAKEVS